MKEFTGHTSDAIDNYQITSEDQRRQLSLIIAGESTNESVKSPKIAPKETIVEEPKPIETNANSLDITITDKTEGNRGCNCKLSNLSLEENEKIGQIVTKLLEGRKFGKATIKLEIEFSDK